MFEKEATEYAIIGWDKSSDPRDVFTPRIDETKFNDWRNGAEFGYNKGYHDAEEHYLNVIDNQHKLVDESKKKDFRKCMKCTDGTYQSGFKDGYNKCFEQIRKLVNEHTRLDCIIPELLRLKESE